MIQVIKIKKSFLIIDVQVDVYNDQRSIEAFTIFIETIIAKLENSQEASNKVIELNGQNYQNIVNQKGLIFVVRF